MRFARWAPSAFALACACGGPESNWAAATVALTVAPPDAVCLRIVAAGATRTVRRDADLGNDAGTVFALSELPTGEVVFAAAAFASPCGQVTPSSAHSWYGVPVRATLAAGTVTAVTIAMHR